MTEEVDEFQEDIYINGTQAIDHQADIEIPEGVRIIHHDLWTNEIFESPIDIRIAYTQPIELPELAWHHLDLVPKKVKFTNSGHTVIYSAKWMQERPYVSGGPLIGNYVFSQLHFHWGANNMEGSEHTSSGMRHILEMHVVFFKSCYLTQESALKMKDGLAVAVYLYNLQDEPNDSINLLTDAIYQIREPHTSIRLRSHALGRFVKPFKNDYFVYPGSVNTESCVHAILWMICREPLGISIGQIEVFRSLIDANQEMLLKNFRPTQPLMGRNVYHVNPSGYLHSTLLALSKEVDPKLASKPQQVNKYPRSSKEYQAATGTTIYQTKVFAKNPFAGSCYKSAMRNGQFKNKTLK